MMDARDGPLDHFPRRDHYGCRAWPKWLRPSRYYITDDDQLILSSEVGVMPISEEHVVKKRPSSSGKNASCRYGQRKIDRWWRIKRKICSSQPYGEWLDTNLVRLKDLTIPNKRVDSYNHEESLRLRKAFGYTYEEVKNEILPMAKNGTEPISAMGHDTPLAALSKQPQPLYNYFKQLFAQVTNPPIDAIREEVVTSTTVYIGDAGNLLEEKAENCHALKIENPILTNTDLLKIKSMKVEGFKVAVIPITYYKNTSLKKAIDHLYLEADRAYKEGANVLILSDRGVDENHVAIPALLAVSAMQQHLVTTKKRTSLSMILESAEPRRSSSFCNASRIWCDSRQPISCIGYDQYTHRQWHAWQRLLCRRRRL